MKERCQVKLWIKPQLKSFSMEISFTEEELRWKGNLSIKNNFYGNNMIQKVANCRETGFCAMFNK